MLRGPAAQPAAARPCGGSRSQRPPHAPRAQPPSQPQQEGPGPGATYPYNAGPGERRQKATIEHVFAPGEGGGGASTSGSGSDGGSTGSSGGADTRRPQAPWSVGWQMSERNLVWNDELRMRLIRRVASDQLGISEAELDARLQEVAVLLPDLTSRLAGAPVDMVVRLAASTHAIAARLLQIKAAFPRADAGVMVSNQLGLLLDDADDLPDFASAAARLRQLLPGIDTDRFAEAFPAVLDVADFERALDDAKRLMPGMDVPAMLRSNPDMVLSLMKGKHLITYDQIDNPFVTKG